MGINPNFHKDNIGHTNFFRSSAHFFLNFLEIPQFSKNSLCVYWHIVFQNHNISLQKWLMGNHNNLAQYIWQKILVPRICYHCSTFTKPNQNSRLILQTKPFRLTRPNTKPYWATGAQLAIICSFVEKKEWTQKRAPGGRCSTTIGNSSEFETVLCLTHSMMAWWQFLSQGATAEHQDEVGEPAGRVRLLFQLPPHLRGTLNFFGNIGLVVTIAILTFKDIIVMLLTSLAIVLVISITILIFEDNVTEKVNLRGRDSLTAGRFLFL